MNDRKSQSYTQAILNKLLQCDMITISQLSKEIDLSEKTIRTKIESINGMLLENELGEIKKKPRVGVWLQANDQQRQKIFEMVSSNDTVLNMSSDIQRVNQALRLILKLSRNTTLTTKQLSDSLYLSVPTTLKVVSECKDWLKMFNIDLNIVRNKGLVLNYSEVSYRLALKHFININDSKSSFEDEILYFMPGLNIEEIKHAIISTEGEWGFEFTEDSFNEIFIYTSLAIYQNQSNQSKEIVISKDEMHMLQQYNEYSFAIAIFKKLEEPFHMRVSNEEIGFLSIQILCSKLLNSDYAIDTGKMLRDYDKNLQEFVKKMIRVVSEVMDVDLNSDEKLYKGLLNHLRPLMFRLRYDRTHTNGLTTYLKTEYRQTFRVTWLVSVLFEEYFDLKVTEDELSYIVLYIQSALERNKNPLKALLVTTSGMGLNQMLSDKIHRSFATIQDIKIISVHDFDLSKANNMDLILSTRELGVEDPRIVIIDDLLSESSVQKISRKYNELTAANRKAEPKFDMICHQMFEPDLIFTHLKLDDKEKILKYLCQHLVKKGYVTKKYLATVLDREAYTPTSIGNGIAIPHGDQNEINEAKIVIATLEHPIVWDTEEVDVIFLLVVKMTNEFEIKRTQQFYKQYVSLIDTDERIDILRKFTDSISFYKYLVR